MANNSSNSNYINISNLPQTQEAVDTDLILLQTENGTQTITFNNFNVVRTDALGNATVIGAITGNESLFESLTAKTLVKSPAYYLNDTEGETAVNGFYNRFTIEGGLVTSANYIAYADTNYTNIVNTVLPNMSAYQSEFFTRTIDRWTSININPGEYEKYLQIDNFFTTYSFIAANQIRPYHFLLTFDKPLSGTMYVASTDITNTAGSLRFKVSFSAPFGSFYGIGTLYARVLVNYILSGGDYYFMPTLTPL